MHRIESENVDESSGKNLFKTSPPYTVMNPEWATAVQEELMNVVERGGQPELSKTTDTKDQVWKAIRSIVLTHDFVVSTQQEFEALFNRRGANQYEILDAYKTVYVKFLAAGYSFAPVLSGGDTWGDVYTNTCVHLQFENGAYINFHDAQGAIVAETDYCLLENVYVRGTAAIAATVTESFLLAADFVEFRSCRCSNRLSSTAMAGFRGSATASHNTTSKYINCSVYDLTTTHTTRVIQGFPLTKNKKSCVVSNLDNTGHLLQLDDPTKDWVSWQQIGASLSLTTIASFDITTLNETDFAIKDSQIDELRTYRFNGASFSLVGSGLSLVTAQHSAITALNSTDIALIDADIDELRTYRFNGANWAQVGNGLAISLASGTRIALTTLNSTDVVFIDSASQDLRAYRFDGTNWALISNSLNLSGYAQGGGLCALNSTDIAIIDETNKELRAYRLIGSDFVQVGNSATVNITTLFRIGLARINATDVIYTDETTVLTYVYRFNGEDWNQIGYSIAPPGAVTSLTSLREGLVVTIDQATDGLRAYSLITQATTLD
jgi:hypothetical protein